MKHSASASVKILAGSLHQIIEKSLISLEIIGQMAISLEVLATGFSLIFTRFPLIFIRMF